MDYKVVVTSDAENDLDQFLRYLISEKKNEQAAKRREILFSAGRQV